MPDVVAGCEGVAQRQRAAIVIACIEACPPKGPARPRHSLAAAGAHRRHQQLHILQRNENDLAQLLLTRWAIKYECCSAASRGLMLDCVHMPEARHCAVQNNQ